MRKPFGLARRVQLSTSSVKTGAAYAALVRRFADQPRVTLPADKRGKFGSNALKVDGKIFAMWVREACESLRRPIGWCAPAR